MLPASNSRELIFQQDKIKLFRYAGKAKEIHTIPLLIVFSTVNRPDILDLFADQSLINSLLEKGIDVYLLDWGYPDQADTMLTFSDYVTRYLDCCVTKIKEKSKQDTINLLGICQGGVISICYTAISEHVNKLVLISTPIDFHTKDNLITKLSQKLEIDSLEKMPSNIPGSWLAQFFATLRPFEVRGLKYLKFADQLHDAEKTQKFLQVEKWLADTPDQPSKAFSEFIRYFYQENQLSNKQYQLNGKTIDLSNITTPVLNIIAKNDEIIPPSASRALKKHIEPKCYTQKVYSSGHIGIYINKSVTSKLATEIARWLQR